MQRVPRWRHRRCDAAAASPAAGLVCALLLRTALLAHAEGNSTGTFHTSQPTTQPWPTSAGPSSVAATSAPAAWGTPEPAWATDQHIVVEPGMNLTAVFAALRESALASRKPGNVAAALQSVTLRPGRYQV